MFYKKLNYNLINLQVLYPYGFNKDKLRGKQGQISQGTNKLRDVGRTFKGGGGEVRENQ